MRYHEHRQFRIYHLRGLFLRIGFAVTLLLVILAFSWKTEAEPKDETPEVEPPLLIIDTIYRIPPLTPPAPQPKPPVTQPVEEVKINPIEDGQLTEEKKELEPDFSLEDAFTSNVITEKEPDIDIPKNHIAPEKMPQFPGGLQGFYKYIRENARFPNDAIRAGGGKVHVTFIVDETGKVVDAKIKQGVLPSLDAEVLRLLKESPRWTPGMMGARKVRVVMTLPIHFHVR